MLAHPSSRPSPHFQPAATQRVEARSRSRRVTTFTLIELLVVVAIISVLASLILPALSKARRMATRSACQSNQSQVGLTVAMYADDFDGFVPPNAIDGVGHTSLIQRQVVTWKDMKLGHLYTGDLSYFTGKHGGITSVVPFYNGDRRIFTCPAGAGKPVNGTLTANAVAGNNKYWLPTATSTGYIGYEYIAGIGVSGDYAATTASNQANYRSAGGVYNPALFSKLDEVHARPTGTAATMKQPSSYIVMQDIARNRNPASYTRHMAHEIGAGCEGVNVLFSDNHVQWFGMSGAYWSADDGINNGWAGDIYVGSEGYITGWRY